MLVLKMSLNLPQRNTDFGRRCPRSRSSNRRSRRTHLHLQTDHLLEASGGGVFEPVWVLVEISVWMIFGTVVLYLKLLTDVSETIFVQLMLNYDAGWLVALLELEGVRRAKLEEWLPQQRWIRSHCT